MIYKNDKFGFYLVILIVVLNDCYCQRRKLNTRCKIRNTGAKGTCLLPTDCPRVQEDTDRGIQPTKCGQYAPNVPIICCQGAHAIFNIPPANEISLLNIPDGLVFPGTGEGAPEETAIDQGAEGYIASQKCREYLPMEQFALLGLSLDNEPTTFNVTKCTKTGVPLIVGGEDVDPGEFPFMAAIGWPKRGEQQFDFHCGGTLISNEYVLTAAHCTHKRDVGRPTVVRLGATNLKAEDQASDPYGENYNIADIKSHILYTGGTHYNDIALVQLDRKISKWTNYIRPACLWTRNSFDTTNAIVTGWGHLEEAGDQSDILQKVTLQLYDKEICQLRYRNMKKLPQGILDSLICSGYLEGGRDTCQGDSGGPLLTKKIDGSCEYYLIGITSFGIGCAKVHTPALYTRVSSYLSWIEKIVWS